MSRDHRSERVPAEATRTTPAKTQTEQAKIRSAEAKTQTEQANTRTAQAAKDSEQANTKSAQAETQSAQDKTRIEQVTTQIKQEKTRTAQAATQTQQTNTRSVEEALRSSELSYRRLFEAAQDGILILEVETGRITDVNPYLIRLLGFSREEMIGQTVGDLSPFKDIVSNQAMLERLQKDGYVRYEDLPLKTKDGRDIAVEFVSNVYQAGEKQVIQCNIRDITKRKQAEVTSNLLAAIVASSDDAIIGKDLNSTITSWNRGAEKIFGYSAREMVGSSILGLIPPDRQKEENHILGTILRGESLEHFETLRQTKAGRLIDVSITASPIKDAAGKAIGVSKVVRDISARKNSEQHLMLLKTCISNLNEIVMITEANPVSEPGPRIVFVNEAFERITGYTSAETLGRSSRFLQGAKTDQQTLDAIQHALAQRQAIRRQVLNYRKDGTEFWMDMDIVPIFDPTGHCTHFVAIERDATTERKHEEQLLWKNSLLEAQLDSSIDGILVVDRLGKHILQNQRLNDLWKFPQQVLDNPADDAQMIFATSKVRHPERFAEKVAYLYNHPDESSHDEIELLDGTILDRNSAPVRNKLEKNYGRIWFFRDITERRKMELKLRQTQKMESIGQLAGGIAHDFNNILSAIIGNSYLIQLDVADRPAVLENLENISHATKRATDLVNQILTFSRQGKQEREPIALNNVVLEALKLLRASVPATIRVQTELTETPTVLANATAIHQIILNLGTNAWHAMRDQTGVLKVQLNILEVDEDFAKTRPDLHPGRYVQLSISDTGCGMDRAMLEHIFEPFFTTKNVGEGTGLGLAVVHGIMKSHDGGISVYSQPGEGTTFHLYFPVIETEETVRKIEATPIPHGQGEHVLFVDDEEALAGLGKKMLERLGYIVTMKTTPLEAIAAVRDRAERFDLVVTDLTMPGMDGTKLGGQLLQLQPSLPIIIMTGYSGVMTAEKARELGFRELLSKPCTARALGEAVHRVLQRSVASEI
jgi:PAS domain S-box-containing protein